MVLIGDKHKKDMLFKFVSPYQAVYRPQRESGIIFQYLVGVLQFLPPYNIFIIKKKIQNIPTICGVNLANVIL